MASDPLGLKTLGPGPRFGWCDCCGAPLPDSRWTPDFCSCGRPHGVAHYSTCERCHSDVYVGHFEAAEEA